MSDLIKREGMDLVAKSITGWLKGFIFLFGVYLVLHSHETPGGGFAGGIIIACAFILFTLAEGQHAGMKLLSKTVAAQLASVGALIFLAATVAGACREGAFFRDFLGAGHAGIRSFFEKNAIYIYDLALALVVSMLIYVVFSVTSAVHVTVKDGKRRMLRQRRS
ncbi:MAG: MnhB domain-containing protein [Kiritimatiellae bacterium]|nr:MnhB domain-containing protein [Kiritimatiellia bacterium]